MKGLQLPLYSRKKQTCQRLAVCFLEFLPLSGCRESSRIRGTPGNARRTRTRTVSSFFLVGLSGIEPDLRAPGRFISCLGNLGTETPVNMKSFMFHPHARVLPIYYSPYLTRFLIFVIFHFINALSLHILY